MRWVHVVGLRRQLAATCNALHGYPAMYTDVGPVYWLIRIAHASRHQAAALMAEHDVHQHSMPFAWRVACRKEAIMLSAPAICIALRGTRTCRAVVCVVQSTPTLLRMSFFIKKALALSQEALLHVTHFLPLELA